MPISATGTCKGLINCRLPPGNACRNGFTLIEVLVVVIIVSIITSMALLSLNLDQGHQGEEEAKRITALLKLAGQQAIISDRELVLEVAKDGYRFLQYRDQQWLPVEDDVLRPRELPDGVHLDTYIYGANAGQADEQEPMLPRIYLLSSGEITPFEIDVQADDDMTVYRITGQGGGKVALAEQ